MTADPQKLFEFKDRMLSLGLARVSEAAAIAAAKLIGHGDEKAADQAAVDAMRTQLDLLDIKGVVVIGEGERDEAPMLYIGEEVGNGDGPEVDIALDPLEGTTLTAKAMPNALAVISMAPRGSMLHAPDVYMWKIAIGPGYPDGVVDLDMDPAEAVRELAKSKGVPPREITVCILERPRHQDIIDKVRHTDASIHLITDGDVAGVIHCAQADHTGIDMYLGAGGAPEGVLAASALKCMGGQIQGRLWFRNEDEKARAARAGITDLDRKYTLRDMVAGDVIFAATGVTDGSILRGARRLQGHYMETETLLMRSKSGSVRRISYRQKNQ
jgi:fructose-1,6-bisphosphatase II / sedoheptulose-1,7-bisphosphatase